MAFGMKSWVGLTALAMVAAGANVLPVTGPEINTSEPELPEASVHRQLMAESSRLERKLQRRGWVDSLSALTIAAAGTDDGFVFGGPDRVPVDQLDKRERRIREESRLLGGVRSDVGLGFFVQSRSVGAVGERSAKDGRLSQEIYIGRRDGVAYCMNLVVSGQGRVASALRDLGQLETASVQGPCHLAARFGPPGPGILAWLKGGGIEFARQPAGFTSARNLRAFYQGTRAFGVKWAPFVQLAPMDAARCRAGIVDGCGAVLVDPDFGRFGSTRADLGAHPELVGEIRSTYGSPFGPFDDTILADLAADFGDERFERFWTSDASFEEAFETAFDTSPGDWMTGWAARNLWMEARGPGVKRGSLMGSMLLVSLCGLLGAAWAGTREV